MKQEKQKNDHDESNNCLLIYGFIVLSQNVVVIVRERETPIHLEELHLQLH